MLDFKRKTDPKTVDLSRDDKKSLGEAASGFANAEGGALVIGVETQNSQGVDRATGLVAIDRVAVVADRYRSYISECVVPPVDGIEVTALTGESSKSGLLLVEIPKGTKRPHMSTGPGHHRFYRRISDRFMQMERYEIEEMFRLKTSPSLSLILDYQQGGSIGGNTKTFIRFGLKNLSRATAKFPYIAIERNMRAPKIAENGLDGNGGTLFSRLTTAADQATLFSGGADIAIHPRQALFISKMEYLHSTDERMRRYWSASSLEAEESCLLEFSFGCEDAPQKKIRVNFTKQNLLELQLPEYTELRAPPHPAGK